MTDILERLRSDLHAEMEDEQPFEAIDKYKLELCEAADEIGRLRNTLRKALAATDFVWAKGRLSIKRLQISPDRKPWAAGIRN